jgi:hypothetical protein
MDAAADREPACSLATAVAFIDFFLFFVALQHVGEACAKESNQFVLGTEASLFTGVYFFDRPLQGTGWRGFPKLDHECSSHDKFRIRAAKPAAVEILWTSCGVCVSASTRHPEPVAL